MSSPIMLAKPEEIDTLEKREKYAVTIIGCEQTGIFQAVLFADAGFKVTCADMDLTKISHIMKCRLTGFKADVENRIRSYLKTGRLNATTEIKKAVSQSDIIAITIPAKIDSKKKPDYSELKNTCKIIGPNLRAGSAIFNMSIAGIGITEGVVKEALENASGYKAGTHFALIYAPIPPSCSSTYEAVKECRRVAAASDKQTLQAATAILESLTKKAVCTTENTRAAEAAILFEIARGDSETATANELACLCEKLGLDCLEAQKLMNHNINYQMLSLGEVNARALDEEAYILLEDAENLNVRLRLLTDAREINEETAKHTVNLVKDALRNCGKTLKRARVVLLGISQILNARGPAARIVKSIAETLDARGVKLVLFDPYFSERELAEFQNKPRRTLSDSLEGADCIVLLVAHEQFKNLTLNRLKHMMKMPAAIVDLTGTFEPDKVEKEGFTYRGLGRGVWSK
jgi:UDP-N-acetyl-D-galactosamine dehydrogenase